LNAAGFRGSAPPRRVFFRTRTPAKLSTLRTEDEATMLGLFRAVMPKEDRFYDLFSQHAATLVPARGRCTTCWRAATRRGRQRPRLPARGRGRRDHPPGDGPIRRSFITPFDRSDIQDLTTSLDDAIDQMRKTAKVVSLFEVKTFEPQMREMARIIVQAAELTVEAVALLPNMRKNAQRLTESPSSVTQIEEQADQMYDQGRKALFLANRTGDPMAFIVGVDIYSHLEKVVDRFEDVANRISGIVVEQV
jgi:hypothetical protein